MRGTGVEKVDNKITYIVSGGNEYFLYNSWYIILYELTDNNFVGETNTYYET